MSVLFKPNGSLDISTDPSNLPHTILNKNSVYSEAMQRCKNIRLDRTGAAHPRYGSQKITTAVPALGATLLPVYWIAIADFSAFISGDSLYADTDAAIRYNTVNMTVAQWYAVEMQRINDDSWFSFMTNGTDYIKIDLQQRQSPALLDLLTWGLAPITDDSLASVGITDAAGLTGDYGFRATYVKKSSTGTILYESNPVPASNSVTLAGQYLECLFWPPFEKGSGISAKSVTISDGAASLNYSHVNIYRTLNGGGIYYLDSSHAVDPHSTSGEIVDHYTQGSVTYGHELSYEPTEGNLVDFTGDSGDEETTYTWEADPSVGTITDDVQVFTARTYWWEPFEIEVNKVDSALGVEVETDHNPPPNGIDFLLGPIFNGVVFAIVGKDLYYSSENQPEYWPVTNFISVATNQKQGVALSLWNGNLYYFNKSQIYHISGSTATTFFPIDMKARTGCQGPFALESVDGKGIYHVGTDGIYLFNGSFDQRVSDKVLDPIFYNETVNDVPPASELTSSWVVFFKNKLFFAYTSSGHTYPSNIIVIDIENGNITYNEYKDGSTVLEFSAYRYDESDDRLLVGDHLGYIWDLDVDTLTKDENTEIDWEIESMDFSLQTRKHFPRWAKYDVVADNGKSEIILDDKPIQTHALSKARDTKRRLIDTNNGDRVSIRLSGTGGATVRAVEME